jgi:hypothetical protein
MVAQASSRVPTIPTAIPPRITTRGITVSTVRLTSRRKPTAAETSRRLAGSEGTVRVDDGGMRIIEA